MLSNRYSPLGGARFNLLAGVELERVKKGAYEILERVGMKLTDERSREILDGAGATIEGDRAHLPGSLVEESIESAPSSLTLYDQSGQEAMELEGDNSYFGASVDGPNLLDPVSETYEDCHERDIGRIVRMTGELSNISFIMPAGFAADRNSQLGEIVSTKQCLLNTDKPLVTITESLDDLKAVLRMAEIKSEDSLEDKPFFVNYAEPISPLINPDSSVKKVLYCAEEEIPLLYSPFLAMGATAPQDTATAVAQATAESLFGLVLHQQVNPGGSFVLGGMPSLMDMETANFSYGAPDLQVMSSAIAELGHHLGLPVFGTAGTGDSKLFDSQAIMEAVSSIYMATLSGANLVHDVGLFGSAKILIPEMIVAVDEIIDLLRNTVTGLDVPEELEIDLLEEAGPGGEFVSHSHTMNNFKNSWYPRFMDRSSFNNQDPQDIETFCDRTNQFVRDFFAEDEGKPRVGPQLKDDLDQIQDQFASKKIE